MPFVESDHAGGRAPRGVSLAFDLATSPLAELRNVIERVMLLLDKEWIAAGDLAGLAAAAPGSPFRLPAAGVNLEEVQRALLVQALEHSHGNQTHAGQFLGINRDQVRYRIEKFGLARLVTDRHSAEAA
jgi:DNA-binding NtrC family response regulator